MRHVVVHDHIHPDCIMVMLLRYCATCHPNGVIECAGGGAFTGRSNTLAGGPSAPESGPAQSAQTPTQPIVHTITFYSNDVFTVNDGEDALHQNCLT